MFVNNVNSPAKFYPTSVAASHYASATGNVRAAQKNDAFTPSREAQSFSEMLKKLRDLPDVREDKVSEFQEKISSGQYYVPSADIAASILSTRF